MNSIKNQLQTIYAKIPKMICNPNCHDCCGPIMMSKTEWSRFKDKKYLILDQMICPYLIDGKCTEYENRPFVCRLFGATDHIPTMICPKGCHPEKKLTYKQTIELCQKYKELSDSEGIPVGPAQEIYRIISAYKIELGERIYKIKK